MADKLTHDDVISDFKDAFAAKRKLIERQRQDYEFALGKQWEVKDEEKLRRAGVLAVTDNRIRPNVFLLTGLERQNRTDFRAFPQGEEDSVPAQIATSLFKNIIEQSDGDFKFSEQFEDGIVPGESHIELFLDSTFNLLNPKPKWKSLSFDGVFPEPGWKEYDFSDSSYIYKLTRGIKEGDLISLFPEKKAKIKASNGGRLDAGIFLSPEGEHVQSRDYPQETRTSEFDGNKRDFDLLERQYKKWIEKVFVVDMVSGEMTQTEEIEGDDRTAEEIAKAFINQVNKESPESVGRFKLIKRTVPEIWVYSLTGGMEGPLANERAWWYPSWKSWSIIPYFGHWTRAPLKQTDSHLNIQGIVAGVKGVQMVHNKSETLKLRHLNSAANSGWISEEDAWVDEAKVQQFGSTPGINLSYKKGRTKPERIFPMPLSSGHEIISKDSTEAIKAQLGINADLLGLQQGSNDSGRLAAIRQRQGVVMVQKLFDNLSRTKKIAGRFLLSQLKEIFDVNSVKKVLGPAFIQKNFTVQGPPDPQTGQPSQELNEEALDATIRKVLDDVELGKYDIAVGEAVASETMRIANFKELQDFATTFPGLVTPDIIVSESQLPNATKERILGSIQQQQVSAQKETNLNSPVRSAQVAKGGTGTNGSPQLPEGV